MRLFRRIAARLRDAGYRRALEKMLRGEIAGRTPKALFGGISDGYWYWLNTEGYRESPSLRGILPAMPDDDVQEQFTGTKGDAVMQEGFDAYRLFRDQYESRVGPLARCEAVLDFGCGWGRIIRFFIKDLEPSKLWGVDPVEKMIELCTSGNRWCNFRTINARPPGPFHDNTFDLIYSFSVFSHLSQEMHKSLLAELTRILKPGGLLIATTRHRTFIEFCDTLRNRPDIDTVHPGTRISAGAFPDTRRTLSDYDSGRYCFSQLVHGGEWSYWGEAAIPRQYVLEHWTPGLEFLDYLDDQAQCVQSVIVMRKPRGG
jgi:SAM-dependent methyltransferase